MARSADQKIVIVTRKTRLEELTERYNTAEQARFYMRRTRENLEAARGRSIKESAELAATEFSDVELEHNTYHAALDQIRAQLDLGIPVQLVDRAFLPNFVFGASDIVVTVGQDGLVANVAKYALGISIVAVNPDPARWDGILLPFTAPQTRRAVQHVLDGHATVKQVTLGETLLNDSQRLLAFNDFFVGAQSHVSARYRIEFEGRSEFHSSSGVLVSTGAGSTGWLSSTFNMAAALQQLQGAPSRANPLRFAWDDPRLCFIVREPFVSKSSAGGIAAGIIPPGAELLIESQMPTHGVVFSDGVEADYLAFTAGSIAKIRAAEKRALLVTA